MRLVSVMAMTLGLWGCSDLGSPGVTGDAALSGPSNASPGGTELASAGREIAPDAAEAEPDAVNVVVDAGEVVPDAGDVVPDAGDMVPDAGVVAPDASVPVACSDPPDAGEAAPDAGDMADAADGCASAPTGDWEGMSRIYDKGGGSHLEIRADVQWTLVQTVGCVDHYQPSGTATYEFEACCCGGVLGSWPLAPTDGTLTIDRTTAPHTYQMYGETSGLALHEGCNDDQPWMAEVSGVWTDNHGWFDGEAFSGTLVNATHFEVEWRFTRVGAVFTSPAPGECSEPASEHWTSVTRTAMAAPIIEATLTWERIETVGCCLDRFQPQGVATPVPQLPGNYCAAVEYDPPTHPVTQGILEIDRSTDPPSYRMLGGLLWQATTTCTHPDQTQTVSQELIGGNWAHFSGIFDGDRFSGGFTKSSDTFAWELTRVD